MGSESRNSYSERVVRKSEGQPSRYEQDNKAGGSGNFKKVVGKGYIRPRGQQDKKKHVLVIMDSNQKYINFKQLFRQHGSATVERIYHLEKAIELLKEGEWEGEGGRHTDTQ